MKKIKGLSMVLGVLLVMSSQTTILKSAASANVPKESAVTQANESDILNISRAKAKQIQNALAQYYSDNDSYPTEKDFNNVIKAKLGDVPKYEDGSLMIKSYIATVKDFTSTDNLGTAATKNEDVYRTEEYRIQFNDDKSTLYDESQIDYNAMSDVTDCGCLFDEDTVENNNLAANRIKAKEIQTALAQCYADDDSYPSEADFNSKIKTKLGDIPQYKDDTPMIKSYKVIKKDKNWIGEYQIQFNDDKSTIYDESKGVNNLMTAMTDSNFLFNGIPEKNILAQNRINAKQIQSELAQYYANYDTYPSSKDFNKAVKSVLGDVPRYKDNTPMVKSYTVSNYDKSNSTYEIVFNDDKDTAYDESKNGYDVMTEHTNTNYLFSGDTIENNKLSVNKIFAKQIQNALAQSYAEKDCYPAEKDFNDAMKDRLGSIPIYGNGVPMIRKYMEIKNSGNQIVEYKIYFNDDESTACDESKGENMMDQFTDVNVLFNQNAVENSNLSINRVKAQEIQYALAQYYAEKDSYPTEKDFANIIKSKLGDTVKYKDNTPMVKKYTASKKSKNQVTEYKIQFNDDQSTAFNESNGEDNIMSQETDTNKLFNANTIENNIISENRKTAKQIQNALLQYYAEQDRFPSAKDFNNVMKSKLGFIPKYKDGTPKVKSYTVKKKGKYDAYDSTTFIILFNDDKSTTYREDKAGNELTEEANANYLFTK